MDDVEDFFAGKVIPKGAYLMKKPEKKEYKIGDDPRNEGYNQCHDEFMEWLPSEEEIAEIIHKERYKDFNTVTSGCSNDIAKAISKRIRGSDDREITTTN